MECDTGGSPVYIDAEILENLPCPCTAAEAVAAQRATQRLRRPASASPRPFVSCWDADAPRDSRLRNFP
eukprot:15860996-Heterocapsa_arctica.AAC.1